MANDIGYDSKTALANKLIKEDGTVTDFAGNPVIGAVVAYDNKPALPNKWLNPDGTISTLAEIILFFILLFKNIKEAMFSTFSIS